MILEMLAGFPADDIAADYITSCTNYYGIPEGTEKNEILAEKNIRDMMCPVAGLEAGASLEGIVWKTAGKEYLMSRGMRADTIAVLEAKLK